MKIIFLILWLGILPLLIGCGWTKLLAGGDPSRDGSLSKAYLFGLATVFATYQCLAVPMIQASMTLTALTRAFQTGELLLAGISILYCRTFRPQRLELRALFSRLFRKKHVLFTLALAAAVLAEAAFVTEYQHEDADDAFYLGTAATADVTDTLYKVDPYTGDLYEKMPYRYVLDPWPLMLASLGRMTSVHPTVFAHLILPPFVLIWGFLTQILFASFFFPGTDDESLRKRLIYLLFAEFFLAFSGFSIYSSGIFLFTRGWQGKAVLCGVFLPLMTAVIWEAIRRQDETAAANPESVRGTGWYWVLLFVMNLAGCLLATMNMLLGAALIGTICAIFAVLRRCPRLLLQGLFSVLPLIVTGVLYVLLRMAA